MWKLLCVTLPLLMCVTDSLSHLEEFGHPFLNPRIVGGTDTNAKSWPWMVSLNSDKGQQFCGGSLITDEWVLTAAHCVFGENKSKIRAHLGKTTQEGKDPHEIKEIKQIIIHENYDKKIYNNDIALLQLSSAVTFNDYIKTVSLADEKSVFVAKTKSWITGWGDIGHKKILPHPGTLQEAIVEVFENKECAKVCGPITDKMICAGLRTGGIGHYKGDSGGPMVNRWCSSWVQSGIISWTEGCAQPNLPDGYTRVSEYRQWIEDQIDKNTKTKHLLGFLLFPPAQCSTSSSDSCHGRCNEKHNTHNKCNCHVDCETTKEKCCSDYDKECNA